jgi:hypothetical protein
LQEKNLGECSKTSPEKRHAVVDRRRINDDIDDERTLSIGERRRETRLENR